jgi:hypothetical protein
MLTLVFAKIYYFLVMEIFTVTWLFEVKKIWEGFGVTTWGGAQGY